jgi:hypothetical protein
MGWLVVGLIAFVVTALAAIAIVLFAPDDEDDEVTP